MRFWILILCFIPLIGFGQTASRSQLNAHLQIGGVTTSASADYTIIGFFNDSRGLYAATDIQVGDIIWDAKCDVYEIAVIDQTTPTLQVQVNDINGAAPTTSVGIVFRPTVNFDYPMLTVGISESLRACIVNHAVIEIDEDLQSGGGGGGITIYGEYKNDVDAGLNGVPIDGYYVAKLGNTMGMSRTIVKRKY